VKLCYSIAYHLQSDSQTEVVNKCLENYLHCMAGTFPTQWVKWLPFAEWWYNINYHTATKSTLYEIIYGYPPLLHISYFPRDSQVEAMDDFFYLRGNLCCKLSRGLQDARHRIIQLANKHMSERSFAIWDLVYIKLQPYRHKTLAYRQSQKLASK